MVNHDDLYEALLNGQIWVSWCTLSSIEETDISEKGKESIM